MTSPSEPRVRKRPPPWEVEHLQEAMRRYFVHLLDLNTSARLIEAGMTKQEVHYFRYKPWGFHRFLKLANLLGVRPSELLKRIEERY